MKEKKIFISDYDGKEFKTKKAAIAHDNISFLKEKGITEEEFDKFVNSSKNTHVQATIIRFTSDWRTWEQRFIYNILTEFKDAQNDIVTYNLYYPVDRWSRNKEREWVTSSKEQRTEDIPTAFIDYANSITDEYHEYEIVKGEEDVENNFTLLKSRLEPHILLERGIELKEEDIDQMIWDYEKLYENEEEGRRWSKSVQTVVEVPNGDIYEILWEKGLTELQENEFYNQPKKLKKFEIVTKMIPVKDIVIEYEEENEEKEDLSYPVPEMD